MPENTIQPLSGTKWKEREFELLLHIPDSLNPILFYFCFYSDGERTQGLVHTRQCSTTELHFKPPTS